MHSSPCTRRLLFVLVAVLLLAACDPADPQDPPQQGDQAASPTPQATASPLPFEDAEDGDVQPPPEPAEAATTPPPDRSVTITSPDDGATVTSPVVLEVEVDGFQLEEIDGSFEDDRGHLYAFIDVPPPQGQERIPEGPDTVRFWDTQVELPDLEAGEHTITVLASHGYPVPMMPQVSDQVTITVE